MRAPSDNRRATMRPRPAPNVWLHSTDCAAAYPTASAMPYSERVAEPEAPLRPRQHRTAQPRYRVASFNYRDGKPFKIRAPAQHATGTVSNTSDVFIKLAEAHARLGQRVETLN